MWFHNFDRDEWCNLDVSIVYDYLAVLNTYCFKNVIRNIYWDIADIYTCPSKIGLAMLMGKALCNIIFLAFELLHGSYFFVLDFLYVCA